MIALRPEQPARILDPHVVLPDMHAVGLGGQRHVDAIVHDQRHAGTGERRLDGARLLDHAPRRAVLVAQLDQRRAAGHDQAGELGERAAVRAFRIDDRVEPHIDGHRTLAFSISVSRSSAYSASRIAAGETAGAGRALAREPAGDAEAEQRRRGRHECVALDREECAVQRRGRAAHRGHARHQGMAVLDRDALRAVGDLVDRAGQRDDRERIERIARQRLALCLHAAERARTRRG